MKIIIALAAALLLAGCSSFAPLFGLQEELDLATEAGTTGLARAIDTYCTGEGPNIARRKVVLAQLNAKTTRGKMKPLDCLNVAGDPDF